MAKRIKMKKALEEHTKEKEIAIITIIIAKV